MAGHVPAGGRVVTVTLHLWMVAATVAIVPVAMQVMYLACLLVLARDLRK